MSWPPKRVTPQFITMRRRSVRLSYPLVPILGLLIGCNGTRFQSESEAGESGGSSSAPGTSESEPDLSGDSNSGSTTTSSIPAQSAATDAGPTAEDGGVPGAGSHDAAPTQRQDGGSSTTEGSGEEVSTSDASIAPVDAGVPFPEEETGNTSCGVPGRTLAQPHPANILFEATFADSSATTEAVAIEFDVAPVSFDQLAQEHPSALSVSSRPGADFSTDGINDEDEINEALSLVNEAGGGLVWLAAGTYHVGSNIVVHDNTVLRGEGRVGNRRTEIRVVDAASAFRSGAGIVRLKVVENVVIKDLVINGNVANQAAHPDNRHHGIYAEGRDITIQRVTVRDCWGHGFNPRIGEEVPVAQVTLLDSYATGNLEDGYSLEGISDSLLAHNVAQGNGQHGFGLISPSSNVTLCGNIASANGNSGTVDGSGFRLHNATTSTTRIDGATVNGNIAVDNSRHGIDLRRADDTQITDNFVASNGSYGIRLRDADSNRVSRTILRDNAHTNTGAYEIFIAPYTDADGLSSPSSDNTVTNNLIQNSNARHVGGDLNSNGNVVDGNQLL